MDFNATSKTVRVLFGLALAVGLCGCVGSGSEPPPTPDVRPIPRTWDTDGDGLITVGFSQTGSESGWRVANSQSIQDFFVPANGFKLVFADAKGDDATQKAQVREFTISGVECIVIVPVNGDGWEPILQEVKDKHIPVINFERKLSGVDQLIQFYFGHDMRAEGDRAVEWLENHIASNNLRHEDIKIVHLWGNWGSDAQMGRSAGLEAGVQKNGWTIVVERSGELSQEKGEAVMTVILSELGSADFNVVWGEDVHMLYGAVHAMQAKGLDPRNYIIITYDGEKTAVQMVKDGIIDAIAECTPLVAPQLGALIKRASNGETIPSPQYVEEEVIDSANADAKLPIAFDA